MLLLFYFLVVLVRGRRDFEHFRHGLIQKLFLFLFFLLLQILKEKKRGVWSLESISAASCVDRSKKKSIEKSREEEEEEFFEKFFVDFEGEI